MQLRPRQSEVLDKIRDAFRSGKRAVMLYAPTGFGKTECAVALMEATRTKGNKSAFLLDRIALCNQTSARLDKYAIPHGVLQSGSPRYSPDEKIQVCSAQTIEKRGFFPEASLLIIDEAHCNRAQTTEFVRSENVSSGKVRVVGLSATPFSAGLSSTFDCIVSAATTRELVDEGSLAPLRVFVAKSEIDMEGAKKVAGEWSEKETTERGIKITGDIVTEWIAKTHEIFGKPEKTIIFCAGVAHGQDLAQKFAEAGYNFVSISYKDDDEFKADAIRDFARPESSIHGLIATDILTKGFDNDLVKIGVSARPFTKSFCSHVQQMGRVMRGHPEKDFALWICHSGNYVRFQEKWDALYCEGVDELSDESEKAVKEPTKKEKEAAKCPKCGHIWGPSDICSHCGHVRIRKNDVQVLPGEMTELTPTEGAKKEKFTMEFKAEWYRNMVATLRAKGKTEGRAYHLYKEKFGCYPANTFSKDGGRFTEEASNYIQRANVAFAKKKAHA